MVQSMIVSYHIYFPGCTTYRGYNPYSNIELRFDTRLTMLQKKVYCWFHLLVFYPFMQKKLLYELVNTYLGIKCRKNFQLIKSFCYFP